MEEKFEQALIEFEKANLDFQQKLVLLQEIQAQYTHEVAVFGNSIKSQQLFGFIYKLIEKLKKDVKLETGYLQLFK